VSGGERPKAAAGRYSGLFGGVIADVRVTATVG